MGWDSDKSLKSETPIWPYLHTHSSDYKQARKILAYTVKKAVGLLEEVQRHVKVCQKSSIFIVKLSTVYSVCLD